MSKASDYAEGRLTREEEHAYLDARNPGPACEKCVYWFLGCLRGREEWGDEPDTPGIRFEGADGKAYPYRGAGKTPRKAYPLRMVCDGFEADPDPTRLGRAVRPRSSTVAVNAAKGE
jgi:hypothetical protein